MDICDGIVKKQSEMELEEGDIYLDDSSVFDSPINFYGDNR